jgi:hypothetical protein
MEVVLHGPARLNKHGHVFNKGVRTPVKPNPALEHALLSDDRFEIFGEPSGEVDAVNSPARRLDMIEEAIGLLEPDDGNFDEATGKANIKVLSERTGIAVTEEERDAAMRRSAVRDDKPALTPITTADVAQAKLDRVKRTNLHFTRPPANSVDM